MRCHQAWHSAASFELYFLFLFFRSSSVSAGHPSGRWRDMPNNDPDGPPPERSARVRPQRQSCVPTVRHPRSVDPRFDDLYGAVDHKQFEDNYKFLREQEEEEERQRRHRIKCLKTAVRRHMKEDLGVDDEEEEQDEFSMKHHEEIEALMFRRLPDVKAELKQLQHESQVYVSKVKGRQVQTRRDAVRKEVIKREVAAVRSGKKLRPFIPKRSQLKREVLAEAFEKLEKKGGKGAVDKYLERKAKGRHRMK
uniref:rRNA biogenesis protein RRP36 n=1 Tax=Trypanosoma congolense (strain IL3000) TaxID=1068625 RepID=G0UU37_TRYCI|nr:conserved hypothetical protein [Trypanosoma congolense IL3000]